MRDKKTVEQKSWKAALAIYVNVPGARFLEMIVIFFFERGQLVLSLARFGFNSLLQVGFKFCRFVWICVWSKNDQFPENWNIKSTLFSESNEKTYTVSANFIRWFIIFYVNWSSSSTYPFQSKFVKQKSFVFFFFL